MPQLPIIVHLHEPYNNGMGWVSGWTSEWGGFSFGEKVTYAEKKENWREILLDLAVEEYKAWEARSATN